jgi:hypothetical protein
VLNPATDDVLPAAFGAQLHVRSDPGAYHLRFSFKMENPTIADLIAKGAARYSVHVECRHNFFRKLYSFGAPSGMIAIPADELQGKVDVSFFVHAMDTIPKYTVAGAHDDYAGAVFAIRPGDLLALAPSVDFDADKSYDALRKISSIMLINPATEVPEGHMRTYFDRDKIEVFLSPADYQRYGSLKGSSKLNQTLIQAISFPVMCEAIRQMRQSSPGEEETPPRWHRRVERRLAELAIDWRDENRTEIEIAQQLLANPVGRFFGEMISLTENS